MTREEIIRNLKYTMEKHKNDTVHTFDTNISVMCKDILDYLEQAPEWIPVSERLPEKNMLCLVSVGKLYLTQTAIYSDLMGTIDQRIFYQGDYGHETFVDITEYVNAWMPLPEAYKAESEDKNADR